MSSSNNDSKKKHPDEQVVVKKVRAYPIKGQLKSLSTGTSISMSIVKLTEIGFLAEVAPTAMQPGEKFDCNFEIPVMNHAIAGPVALMKLYHQGVFHLVEMHFMMIGEAERMRIQSFLHAIRSV